MNPILRALRDVFTSLQLTVVLLVFSMILIFAATLDQVNLGIWAVQEKYFHSFVIYLPLGRFAVPAFPGGYTVGGLLLLNLLAAHVYRFTLKWRKTGIVLTHLGLIVLLVGELLSGLWQEDFHMRLNGGETKNYAESPRYHELVLIDTTNAAYDEVTAIAEGKLARKAAIENPRLPFRIVPKSYYPNSSLHVRTLAPDAPAAGVGEQLAASPQPFTTRPDERNVPSAILDVVGPDGAIGTFLVSAHLAEPSVFTFAGHTWKIGLRVKRAYQQFSLTLLKFSHDRYPGTDIPKNFSSRLRLTTPDGRDNRDVLIFMNNPLRYGGLTFYQAGFENDDRTTILQVVRNPSWILPYVACALMALGLIVQFGLHLFGFLGKRRAAAGAGVRAAPIRPSLPPVKAIIRA
jgi:hypothetical protein